MLVHILLCNWFMFLTISFNSLFFSLFVPFLTTIQQLYLNIICFIAVYYIDEPHDNITLYEGQLLPLRYQTFRRQRDIVILKSGTVVCHGSSLNISHVRMEDKGIYYAKCSCVRSKVTTVNVLRKFL